MRPKPNKSLTVGDLAIFDVKAWNHFHGSIETGSFIIKVLEANDNGSRLNGEVMKSADKTNPVGSTCPDYIGNYFKKIAPKQFAKISQNQLDRLHPAP